MRITLAEPRGFCAGVTMAVGSLQRALERFGEPLYVYHEIVHNRWIVEYFQSKGVVFVDHVKDVPRGSRLLYSAHGVSPEVRSAAETRGLKTIDATCPLVRKVHMEVERYAAQGRVIFLVGHEGHDEVVGTRGVAPEQVRVVGTVADVESCEVPDPDLTAYVTQTTLSVDDAERIVAALRVRFPNIVGPAKGDICYATQNRQEALRLLAPDSDVVIVVGSKNSSNSNRLVELARDAGRTAYLVDGPDDLQREWFAGDENVLITAGASAPECLVIGTVERLRDWYQVHVDQITLRLESQHFPLPAELQDPADTPQSLAILTELSH